MNFDHDVHSFQQDRLHLTRARRMCWEITCLDHLKGFKLKLEENNLQDQTPSKHKDSQSDIEEGISEKEGEPIQ